MEQIKNIILNNKDYKITETAYRQLSDFLKHLKKQSQSEDQFLEFEIQLSVLSDMELEQKKQKIITREIISEIIKVLKENRKIKYKQSFYSNNRFQKNKKSDYKRKRNKIPLKRNISNKILSGVCSGIARKLGIDPIFIRILFLLLALFRGFFIPIYIILWIVIPADEHISKYKKTISL